MGALNDLEATPWDAIAAGRAGIPFLGLLTGGFAECELRRAGAVEVFEELVDLQRHLGL